MVSAYGQFSASATGGNGFARDFLAGMCALYTSKMYHKLGVRNSQLLLFGFGALFCIPVWVFYYYGPQIRKRSKFAMSLAQEKEKKVADKTSTIRRDQEQRAGVLENKQ